MKVVSQNQFGGPDSPTPGNCYAACIASLLDLDISEVPHFIQLHREPEDVLDAVLAFLSDRGYTVMRFDWNPWLRRYTPGALAIFAGRSPRGDWNHAVVGEVTRDGWRMVHDPHPSGDGIVGDPIDVEFLFPVMRAAA